MHGQKKEGQRQHGDGKRQGEAYGGGGRAAAQAFASTVLLMDGSSSGGDGVNGGVWCAASPLVSIPGTGMARDRWYGDVIGRCCAGGGGRGGYKLTMWAAA